MQEISGGVFCCYRNKSEFCATTGDVDAAKKGSSIGLKYGGAAMHNVTPHPRPTAHPRVHL